MEELRLSAVATRVVAWHNRHPLARRITAAQVHAIGYVALPFSDPTGAAAPAPVDPSPAPAAPGPEGGTLRQRAQARARQQDGGAPAGGVPTITQLAIDPQQLDADFSEDFIDPLSPRDVARFARRRGQALVRAPSDGPVRRVRADGRQPDGGGLTLYLLTAVIETGTSKSRVLLGAGQNPAVLGRRVLAPARAAAVLLPLMVAGAWLYHQGHKGPAVAPAPVVVVAAAASASAVAQPASAPPVAPLPPIVPAAPSAPIAQAPASASAAASAPAPLLAAPEAGASAPIDVEPRLGRIDMPSIRPQLRDSKRRAGDQAASAAAAPAPPPPEPAFALSTRPLRTRAEADQVRIAMKSLLRATSAAPLRVDVMAEGDDWRVVGLPFATQADADKARALLLSRGMKVVVVGF